jgi:hypothetical protein
MSLTYSQFESMLADDLADAGLRVRSSTRGLRQTAIEFAVREWTDPPLNYTDRQAFKEDMQRRIKVRFKDSMNPFVLVALMAVISAVVQYVVRKLLEFWLEDRLVRSNLLWNFRAELERNGHASDDIL